MKYGEVLLSCFLMQMEAGLLHSLVKFGESLISGSLRYPQSVYLDLTPTDLFEAGFTWIQSCVQNDCTNITMRGFVCFFYFSTY